MPSASPSNAESLIVTKRQLRRIVQEGLRTSSQLDAFCIDYFPKVYAEFGDGMNRTQKLNLLLLVVKRDELLESLRHQAPEVVERELSVTTASLPSEQWRGENRWGSGLFNLRVYGALATLLTLGIWLRPDLSDPLVDTSAMLRPRMLRLRHGTFQMGSLQSELGFSDDIQHKVTITTDFFVSETEVTERQYENVMNGYPDPNLSSTPSYFTGDLDQPVDSVSFFDAIKYCNALSKKEQLLPCYELDGDQVELTEKGLKCYGYRLLTEAEWEYAARANADTKYAGADDLDDVAWYEGNAEGNKHKVGLKKANGWGLYDMSGNVWEWVWDRFTNKYETLSPENPAGPATGLTRLYRGGSIASNAAVSRLSNRRHELPDHRYPTLGFRLARSYH